MARELQALGYDAAALEGGYNAWRAAYPVEPKGERAAQPASIIGEDQVVQQMNELP